MAKKGIKKLFRYTATFAIALVILAILAFTVWRLRLRREINDRIAAIHAKGFPVDWEELSKWPLQVDDAENAALIYTNAIGHLIADGVTDNYRFAFPPRSTALSDPLRATLHGVLRTNQVSLDIIHNGSLLLKSRYPIHYEEGPVAKLPHLNGLNRLIKLLECEALSKADAGDADGAAKAIISSFEVARSLDAEPFLTSQLIGSRMLDTSCDSLERVLNLISLSDQKLEQISKQLVSAETTNRFLTALVGERAMNGEFIRLAQDDVRHMIAIVNQGENEGEKIDLPRRDPGAGWRFLGFFTRDRNFYLRGMETNILIEMVRPPVSLSLTNEAKKLEAQAQNGFYICSALFLPGLSRTAIHDASTRAILRVALTAVAIARWRENHNGTIPDSLETLVPALMPSVPLDPYDGQPLRFKKMDEGSIVYSIGLDQTDDGGKEKPLHSPPGSNSRTNHFDITFTVNR